MSRTLAFKIDDNVVKKLGVIYGNLNKAGHRAVLSWHYLRTSSLEELKGIFSKAELILLINMRRETKFEPKFASGTALAYEVTDAETLYGIATEWGVDVKVLSEKLNQLSYPHSFFLSDWIDCFWINNHNIEDYIGGLL